jgi:hypothetical protein
MKYLTGKICRDPAGAVGDEIWSTMSNQIQYQIKGIVIGHVENQIELQTPALAIYRAMERYFENEAHPRHPRPFE